MLYAFHQCKHSDLQIAFKEIDEAFSPHLNSMEVTDPDKLSKDKKSALLLFKEHYESRDLPNTEDEIHKITNETIRKYHERVEKDYQFLKNRMINQVESIHDIYLKIMLLPVEFAEIAEKSSTKRENDPANFVKNLLIYKIKYDNSLQQLILKKKISWDNDKELVRSWYRDYVRNNPEFVSYLKKRNTNFAGDKEIVNYILRSIVLKSDVIDAYFEEHDLNWSEDKSIVKGMIKRTMKVVEEDKDFPVMELSVNWEEDKTFFEELFENTVREEETIETIVAEKIRNWDIERVAEVDRIILNMAVAELKNFPSIPVKVTINEYIEISKSYSTPKSKFFVNGVLDVLAKNLLEKGEVKKSGRGLIDNK